MTQPAHESQGHRPVIEGTTVPDGRPAPLGRAYDPFAQGAAPSAPPTGAVQPWVPVTSTVGPPPVVVMPAQKSVGVAFVLTFFFGVFGLFYATVPGALLLIGITIGAILLAAVGIGLLSVVTFGFGAALFALVPLIGVAAWIASIVWGCLAAAGHNERLRAQYAQAGFRPPGN